MMNRQNKVTDAQLAFMKRFMQENPYLAAVYHCSIKSKKLKKLWQELVKKLNNMKGPTKTLNQWRQYWNYHEEYELRKAMNNSPTSGKTKTKDALEIADINSEKMLLDFGKTNFIILSSRKPKKCKLPATTSKNTATCTLDNNEKITEDAENNNIIENNNNDKCIATEMDEQGMPESTENTCNCITENYIVSSVTDPNSEGMPLIPDYNCVTKTYIVTSDNSERCMLPELNCVTENYLMATENPDLQANNYISPSYIVTSIPPETLSENISINPNYLVAAESADKISPNYLVAAESVNNISANYLVGAESANNISPSYLVGAESADNISPNYLVAAEYADNISPNYLVAAESADNISPNYLVAAESSLRSVPFLSEPNYYVTENQVPLMSEAINPGQNYILPQNNLEPMLMSNDLAPNYIVSSQPHPVMMVASGVELYSAPVLVSSGLDLGSSYYIVNQ